MELSQLLTPADGHPAPDAAVSVNAVGTRGGTKLGAQAAPADEAAVDGASVAATFAALLDRSALGSCPAGAGAVIRDGYYHPDFHGSLSIKQVLPVLVPDMTYDDLGIRDGLTASAQFARMAQGRCDEGEARALRQDLETYCHQDTLAMVRLHEKLLELAR